MNSEQYISERLDDQITWYDRKSIVNQMFYKRIQLIQIVFSSFIVLLAGLQSDAVWVGWLIAAMSMVVAISTGLNGLYKFQENWINYRTIAETLKHEKFIYLTKTTPYDSEDSFNILVGRVEGVISRENTNWEQYIKASANKHA